MKNRHIALFALLLFLPCRSLANDNIAADIKQSLSNQEQDFPLPFNSILEEFVKDNSTEWLLLQESYPKFLIYEYFLKETLDQNNLPQTLRLLPWAISYMQTLYNKDDRCGAWGLTTPVAIHYGLSVNSIHDERFDFVASTNAALSYINFLHNQYKNWWDAIIAFTSSPSALNSALIRSKRTSIDIWNFYKETDSSNREIIPKLLLSIYLSKEKQKANINEQKKEECIEAELKKPISIKLLALELGIKEQKIKDLNPVFRSDIMIPLKNYKLLLPKQQENIFYQKESMIYSRTEHQITQKIKEKVERTFNTNQATTDSVQNQQRIVYIIKPGDSLSKIAQRYNVSVEDIMKWNNLLNSELIRIDDKLIIFK